MTPSTAHLQAPSPYTNDRENPNPLPLSQAVLTAPVVVGFTVDDSFQFYSGGVYAPDTCTTDMDHAREFWHFSFGGGVPCYAALHWMYMHCAIKKVNGHPLWCPQHLQHRSGPRT